MNFDSRFIEAQHKKLLLSKRSRLSAVPEADCFQTKSFATELGLAWPGLAWPGKVIETPESATVQNFQLQT